MFRTNAIESSKKMNIHTDCPKCGRHYDDIDFDYQSCHKCGWDAEKETFEESIEPTDEDFLNGDADILTGQWL